MHRPPSAAPPDRRRSAPTPTPKPVDHFTPWKTESIRTPPTAPPKQPDPPPLHRPVIFHHNGANGHQAAAAHFPLDLKMPPKPPPVPKPPVHQQHHHLHHHQQQAELENRIFCPGKFLLETFSKRAKISSRNAKNLKMWSKVSVQ